MRLHALQERKQEKVARQQELLNNARSLQRSFTEEEDKEFNCLQSEIEELAEQIRALEENPEKAPKEPVKRTAEEEQTRILEIGAICRYFGVDSAQYIKDNSTIEQVRAAVMDKLLKEKGPVGVGLQVTKSEEDKYREAAADALLMRGGLRVDKPAEGSRELMGLSLKDLGVETLERAGEQNARRKRSDDLYNELLRSFYNPTAAFPAILDTAINKSYELSYNRANATFDQWASKGVLTDFKESNNTYLMGSAGMLERVGENGELKADLPTDELRPKRKLETYGRQFTMSRQAFINDDIGFVTSLPERYAQASKKTINTQVYEILMSNPVVYDGMTLFNAKHKNLVTVGKKPTQESVQHIITALGMQKDKDGNALIIRPGNFVLPLGFGMQMYSIFNSPTMNTVGNTQASNPLYQLRNQVGFVEDATINALAEKNGIGTMPWFAIADTSDCPFIQVDYLNGEEIPKIRRSEQPGVLGFVWDIYNDWGITVMDYKGAVKNPGTAFEFTL